MKTIPALICVALVALAWTNTRAHAASISYDFTDPTELDANFLQQPGDNPFFEQTAAAGVGGISGRVEPIRNGAGTSIDVIDSFDLSSGDTFTLSILFLTPNAFTGSTAVTVTAAQIGFMDPAPGGDLSNGPEGFNTTNGNSYISCSVVRNPNSTLNNFSLKANSATDGVGTSYSGISSFTLAPATWYELSASFTRAGSTFAYSESIFGRGADGTAARSAITNGTRSGTTNAVDVLATGTDTLAGFNASQIATGPTQVITALDDFVLIPEPASGALLAGSALLLVRSRRRKTRTL